MSTNSTSNAARRAPRLVVESPIAGLVAQPEIAAVDRQRQRPRPRPARAARRASAAVSIASAPVLRQHQPELAMLAQRGRSRPAVRCARRGGRTRNRAPARCAFIRSRWRSSIGDAVVADRTHRLDQVESAGCICHERPLRQTFAPFVVGAAVGHDARTQTQSTRQRIVACFRVSVRMATLNRCFAVGRKPSDRIRYRRRAARSRARR